MASSTKLDDNEVLNEFSPRLIDEIDEDDEAIATAVANESKNVANTVLRNEVVAELATIAHTDEAFDDFKTSTMEESLRQQEDEGAATELLRDVPIEQRPPPDDDAQILPAVPIEPEHYEHPEFEENEPPQQRQEDQLILDNLPPDLIDDILLQQQQQQRMNTTNMANKRHFLLTYRPLSFIAFAALIWYALRTRKQYYFTAVYLSHSKYAYVILGNTVIATAIILFDITIYLFFRTTTPNHTGNNGPSTTTTTTGLRMQEAEGLQDFFRWNVTETCLALTMFRYELTIVTAIQFVFLILLKCLHYVAAQREQHLRMTEDAIIVMTSMNATGIDEDVNLPSSASKYTMVSYIKSVILFIRSNHTCIIVFFVILQGIDMYIIQHCILQILNSGQASVKILFAFEAAILLVSTYCHVILYILHVVDCAIQYGHDVLEHAVAKKLLHPWKEYKATFIFAIELQAQAINFLFYCTFFCIVLTFYGLPINLFREVYMSFMKLKERLTSFFHYRQLMASMNRFRTATDEELNQSGRTCIICRDEMTSGHDCKRLPICAHTFHKSCLREWLVQQQSCPTCRADIAAMEALEASRSAAANAATQRTATAATDTTNATTDVIADETTSTNPSNDIVLTTASSSMPFSTGSTTTDIHTSLSSNGIGVVHPIHPTLYEVVGTHNNDSIIDVDVPVYSQDCIVTTRISTHERINNADQIVPVRIIRRKTLVLGMAKYQKPESKSSDATAAAQTITTYVQLPDQTWIQDDYLRSICTLSQTNENL